MKFITPTLLAIATGCCNISAHMDDAARPFCGTRGNLATMSEVFVSRPDLHHGCPSEAGIAHAYSVVFSPVLLPLLLVDLPLEVVADVVTMPYDLAR